MEPAKSEKRFWVGGSLNDQPPILRKTFRSGLVCFSAVVRFHRSASPGVISTISNDADTRAKAKLTCVNVLTSICSGEKEEHFREFAQPS